MKRVRRALAGAATICCAIIVLLPVAAAHARRPAIGAHAARHAAGHHPRPALLRGINLQSALNDDLPAEIQSARQLHARVVRVDIPWAAFEPLHRGRLDPHAVAAADRLMRSARAAGIRVVAFVDHTPCWASSAPRPIIKRCRSGASSSANAWPPRHASDYGRFVAWLAKRYGKSLAAIEVWNEPDQINQDYLAGPNKPREYAKLLRAAYPAIKHADRHIKVLAGSLVGSNGTFLNALYAAGIKGYYDALAVHFYTLGLAALRGFHSDQVAHNDHKPLWLDEFGWSSCWPAQKAQQEQGCVTKKTQARNLADTFKQIARTRWVSAAISYDLRDRRSEQFGVLTAEGKRKPAFRALAKVLRSPFGKPSPVTLSLTVSNGQVIADGSGPVGDYMQLEAFQHGALRYRALFTLNRFNRYSIKLPQALGASDLAVRVWQYWSGRKHAAHATI